MMACGGEHEAYFKIIRRKREKGLTLKNVWIVRRCSSSYRNVRQRNHQGIEDYQIMWEVNEVKMLPPSFSPHPQTGGLVIQKEYITLKQQTRHSCRPQEGKKLLVSLNNKDSFIAQHDLWPKFRIIGQQNVKSGPNGLANIRNTHRPTRPRNVDQFTDGLQFASLNQ
jgi:hypothetical protein